MRTAAVALDARAVVDQSLVGRPPPPFSHLAIRPYPEEYTREATTTGGLHVTLRPIRPEDEPLWHEMLDACSPESIQLRFRGMVKHTHELATRYCFIDYDRELAIVAELEEQDGTRKLLGVGRLVADPDRQSAEYAVLVADPWQGRGLSDLLTDYCLEIARAWGIRSVYAETTPDNARMIAVLKQHGFTADAPRRGRASSSASANPEQGRAGGGPATGRVARKTARGPVTARRHGPGSPSASAEPREVLLRRSARLGVAQGREQCVGVAPRPGSRHHGPAGGVDGELGRLERQR